jgi:RHS repeat-associated protein
MNITSKTLMTMAAAMAITLTGWAKTLPGVAPMSPEKLAAWRAEEMRINAPKAAAKSDLAFYTGKPYAADLNAYLFPFRNYSPDLCRWTIADPSGFPDGANNYCYAPTPNMGCDPLGLKLEVEFVDSADGKTIGVDGIPSVQKKPCGGKGAFGSGANVIPTTTAGVFKLKVTLAFIIDSAMVSNFDAFPIGKTFIYTTQACNFMTGPAEMIGGIADFAVESVVTAHEIGHAKSFNTFVRSALQAYCDKDTTGNDAAGAAEALNKFYALRGSVAYLTDSSKQANDATIKNMTYSSPTKKLVKVSETASGQCIDIKWKMVSE